MDLGLLYENYKPDSALYWYSIASDTVYSEEKIKAFPGRTYYNATLVWYSGIVYDLIGNRTTAGIYYYNAMRMFETAGDMSSVSKCLISLGILEFNYGNYFESGRFFERSLKIAEGLNDEYVISGCLNNLGVIYMNQGNYNDALSSFKRSEEMNTQTDDKTITLHHFNNLGKVCYYKGDYQGALKYYEQAYAISKEINDQEMICSYFNAVGLLFYDMGNIPEAILNYEKSLEIAEQLGDQSQISKPLSNMGLVWNAQGDKAKALEYYERSLKIKEAMEDKAGMSSTINNIGLVLQDQGNLDDALSYYNKSLEYDTEMDNRVGIADCNINIGSIYLEKGDYSSAVRCFENSVRTREETADIANLSREYPYLGRAYKNMGMYDKAIGCFLNSSRLTRKLLKDNFSILSESDKELYLNKTKSIFNELNSFLFETGFITDSLYGICYDNELLLKGLLLSSSRSVLDAVNSGKNKDLKEAYFHLKQVREEISELQGTYGDERDKEIDSLETVAVREERRMVILSSGFAETSSQFNLRWKDIQKDLGPGEAAVEFITFTKGTAEDSITYAALLITKTSIRPEAIKLFNEADFLSLTGKSNKTGYKYVSSLYGSNSTNLYNLIWKPLESKLEGVSTVYFAPAGVLNRISFAALGKDNSLLCDRYNLIQVGTTGKITGRRSFAVSCYSAALFGGIDYNPGNIKKVSTNTQDWQFLPGTLKEIKSIEIQLSLNKVPYSAFAGKKASEENFKSLFDSSETPAILHISTHGFFYPDPENRARAENENEGKDIQFRGSSGFGSWMFVNNRNPLMRSGLIFAGANRVWSGKWERTNNEGVLTAYEVSNLNMTGTNLVVLSACETGLGDIRGSEGVYGLQRAFKMAGVKYIIMSLWQVPDKETVEFMEMFYKKLLKYKEVRRSFNETQKEMRKRYDPYYWAAFVLIE